ncbi:MAG: hypothetical protein M3290_09400 [Actinomycetota bacterium]|nr:hypothetical protein [Actinomycetota bacterium]
MSDDEARREGEEERERPRPRVVDKRVSAGGAPSPSQPQPSPPAPPAEPEPQASEAHSAAATPEAEGARSHVWTPEQEAEARRVAEEIVATPSLDWVVNAAVTMANVAATKLELGDPADASLAIDALAALVNGLDSKLGDALSPLRSTLAQLQMSFAQIVTIPPKPDA